MFTPGIVVQRMLRQTRHALTRSLHVGRSPLALSALLLLGSTWSVMATANTAPAITSLTLSSYSINEGDTVILTGTFTDPDPGDSHDIQIRWHDPSETYTEKQKIHLPAGQLTFQVPHKYTDATIVLVSATVYDRQLPVDANDNVDGTFHWDVQNAPTLTIHNVAPRFIEPSITVTKAGGKAGGVVVEGSFTEPVDPVNVRATWGDAVTPQQAKAAMPCIVNQKARTFKCEHSYKTSPAASYQIRLMADDGHGPKDGGEDSHTVLVQIP